LFCRKISAAKAHKAKDADPMHMMIMALFAVLALAGCHKAEKVLPDPRQSKQIVVVTHNGPHTYYVNGDNDFAGLEYDLAKLFAKELGSEYTVKFVIVDNITQVIPTLLKGKAHLAAANLSVTPLRRHLVRFSAPYQTVQQQVVFNQDENSRPRDIGDLIGHSIAVPGGTSFAERLEEIGESEPRLQWREPKNANADELVEQVAEGLLDYTIADAHLVAMLRNYHPNLGAGFNVGEAEKVAWAFPKTGDSWLYERANAFFERIKQDGTLRNLIDRYYGHSERLGEVDVTAFLRRSRTELPQFIHLFKQAQELTGLDWRLLAAISYQESHWDPLSTSPTNVRGLMMLTEATSDRLDVTDRLDPKQSILGGARYILMLKETLPERIKEPDRTWMALAAYNIGFAHLEDARILAERLKLNPDRWADVKKTLPLLNKAKYYSTLKYGYARGGAPVIYVESIRTYYKILQRYAPPHRQILPSFNLAWLSPRVYPTR
jgi:membrane-bound lytic murein transglycosylase F